MFGSFSQFDGGGVVSPYGLLEQSKEEVVRDLNGNSLARADRLQRFTATINAFLVWLERSLDVSTYSSERLRDCQDSLRCFLINRNDIPVFSEASVDRYKKARLQKWPRLGFGWLLLAISLLLMAWLLGSIFFVLLGLATVFFSLYSWGVVAELQWREVSWSDWLNSAGVYQYMIDRVSTISNEYPGADIRVQHLLVRPGKWYGLLVVCLWDGTKYCIGVFDSDTYEKGFQA